MHHQAQLVAGLTGLGLCPFGFSLPNAGVAGVSSLWIEHKSFIMGNKHACPLLQSKVWFKVLKKVGGNSSHSSPYKTWEALAELSPMSRSAHSVRVGLDHSAPPPVRPKLDTCWGGCILYLLLAPGPVSLPALQETDEVV